MADVPTSVGWLTVTLFADEALADSTDTGEPPDRVGLNGTVTLTPAGLPAGRRYLVDVSSGDPEQYRLIVPRRIVCPVVDGVMYAPDNGSEGSEQAQNGVRIIPTISTGLDIAGWWWQAEWQPQPQLRGGPPTVPPFDIPFVGRDGDTINLAAAAMNPPAVAGVGTVLTPVWESTDVPPDGVVDDALLPAGAKAGQLILDTTTGDLKLIS
jgi:hypothetical protein